MKNDTVLKQASDNFKKLKKILNKAVKGAVRKGWVKPGGRTVVTLKPPTAYTDGVVVVTDSYQVDTAAKDQPAEYVKDFMDRVAKNAGFSNLDLGGGSGIFFGSTRLPSGSAIDVWQQGHAHKFLNLVFVLRVNIPTENWPGLAMDERAWEVLYLKL